MASGFTTSERNPFERSTHDGVDLHHASLRRTRSRRKRKMQEMEEKRRIRGDSHWSKLLQVNNETNGFKPKRCIRMCRSIGVKLRLTRDRTPDESEQSQEANTSTPEDAGFLATIAARVRHWLHSKRKYEVVSPEALSAGGGGMKSSDGCHPGGSKTETIKEDYIVISQLNSYHPELKRSSGSSNPLNVPISGHRKVSRSTSAVARNSSNCNSPHYSPASFGHSESNKGMEAPPVNINIEFADNTQAETRSHFVNNPLKLSQNHSPKTAIMTPATRALSRSQQLRQSRSKYMKLLHKAGQLSPGRTPLTGTISAPAKNLGEKSSSPVFKRRPIKTWPLPGRKQYKTSDDEDPVGDSEMELPFMQEMRNYDRFGLRGKSSLKDFSIQFKDLNLGELSREGRRCKLYKGRWHGDVIVHRFGELRQKDKEAFWANLGKLCRIRHENIILFMAACTNPPDLAVVTSKPQGKSLYEHIHVSKEKMTTHTRIQVLRQIAQGMGYLHAKGIVLRKLNTKNVFIGHKVKVSAMDFGFPDHKFDRPNYGSIPRGHLSYVAPEILATVRVIPPRLMPTNKYTTETDVFAFGTIMYEVFTGKFPFENTMPEKIIWQVCSGHRQILYSLKCSEAIKSLIEDCWAHEPLYRPEFRELVKDLQRHSPLHKKHSSSVPEKLHRTSEYFDL